MDHEMIGLNDEVIVLVFGTLLTRDVLSFSCVCKNHARIFNLDCVLRTILLTHNVSSAPEGDFHRCPVSDSLHIEHLHIERPGRYSRIANLIRMTPLYEAMAPFYEVRSALSTQMVDNFKIDPLKKKFLQNVKQRALPLNWKTQNDWRTWKSYSNNNGWYLKISGYQTRSAYLSDWLRTYISNTESIRKGLKTIPALQWAHAPKAKLQNIGSYHQTRCHLKNSVHECPCDLACLLQALYPGVSDSDHKYSIDQIMPRFRNLKKEYVKRGMMFSESEF